VTETSEREKKVFRVMTATCALISALFAVALALDRDPRSYALTGMAIGSVIMWVYNGGKFGG
jgi:hypothetical protein